MTQFSFDHSFERLMKHEGGYVNHPSDPGGETNHGVTKRVADKHKAKWALYGFNGNMKQLPIALAKQIYKEDYWDKVQGDYLMTVHPILADHMFDMGVNAGTTVPVKHLQEALNLLNQRQRDYKDIKVDGGFGNGTKAALNQYIVRRGKAGLENLIFVLLSMQNEHYLNLSRKNEKFEDFTNGWTMRTMKKTRAYVNALENL